MSIQHGEDTGMLRVAMKKGRVTLLFSHIEILL